MKNLGLVSFLLLCAFLASCQVKQGNGGSLVSGHLPATNTFTLVTPTAYTYASGETVSLTVTFPFDMTIDTTGGTPRLVLSVNGVARNATYAPQGDARKLVFNYTFASETDSAGIFVTALQLNGSTCTYSQNGTPTACDVSTITSTQTSIKVDATPPAVSVFTLTNLTGLYNVGESITYTMQFTEPVTVTGTPRFPITVNIGAPTTTVNVDYVSGSGSNLLTFSFVVASTHDDTNGYPTTGLINLNGGTIRDAVGNNATLDFSGVMATANTQSANVDINGIYPYVVSVTAPSDAEYTVTQNMDFIVTFNRSVTVSGTPYLPITVGSTAKQALYVSGSPGTAIRFRYQVVPGDYDPDGIVIGTSLNANSGGITGTSPASNYFLNGLNNVFSVPATPGVLVSAQQPAPISVARNVDTTNSVCTSAVDNFWNVGQYLYISVVFNTPVYVTQTGGVPSIPLTFTSGTRQATYLSGGNGQTTLVFQYLIVDGDEDLDGTIGVGTIALNGGVITDAALTNVTLTLPVSTIGTTSVDGTKPTISSVTPSTNGVYSTVTPLTNTQLTMTVNWSENVRFSSMAAAQNFLAVDFDGTNRNFSTATANNSASYIYSTTSLAGLNDANGITLTSPLGGASTVTDCRGNVPVAKSFTLPTTTGILVDTTAPELSSLTKAVVDGYYNEGDTLNFTAGFSEPVTVLSDGTNPSIPITIGSTLYNLTTSTNATLSSTHTFRYTVANNDLDTNGVAVGTTLSFVSPASNIIDAGRNPATANFASPGTTGVLVDAVAPTVSSVVATVSGSYVEGNSIQIAITYSENVTVTGTPFIGLDFDQGTDNLVYSSVSGNTVVFSRTLAAGHFDMTGLASALSTITYPVGDFIRDAGGNDVPATFTTQDFSGIYVTYPAVKLWVQSNFVNLAPATAAAVTNAGVISTESCGTATCRTFNGDDSLTLSGSISNIKNVLVAVKIPASTGLVDLNLFNNDIRLASQITHYDLKTAANSTVTVNSTSYATGVNHDTNFVNSSTYILQVIYNGTNNYSSTVLIPTTFDGAIGEEIATDNTLTAPQLSNLKNYLDAKY